MPRLACSVVALGALLGPASVRAQDLARPLDKPEPSPAPQPRLTKPPVLLAPVEPAYPPDALSRRLSADVTLVLDIDADGNVTHVEVLKAVGHGFDQAASAAASEMKFEPAEIDGKPGAIRIEYTMHFVPRVVVEAPPPEPSPEPREVPAPALPDTSAILARGRVREKGTRTPLPAADVTVVREGAADSGKVVATTDADGRFELRGVPARPGRASETMRLLIGDGEHDPCVRDVEVPAAGHPPVEVNCFAAAKSGGVYETIVRAPPSGEDVTRHTVSAGELRTVPGTYGDPLRVIQNLPGIARAPYGLGLLIVRGSSPQDTGVYVDGHRVPLLYHFLGGPSILTPSLIGKIDFYPGGFGVRYGRNIAGVIDVGTRAQPPAAIHGSADVNLIDSSAFVEGPIGAGVTGGVAARRSYVDLLLPFVIPERAGSTAFVVTPVYYDYQTRVDRPLGQGGRRGTLSLLVFGSNDSLKVIAQDPAQGNIDLGTRIGFHRVIGAWTTTHRGWTSRLSPGYGYDLADFKAGTIGGEGRSHVVNLREDLSRPIGKRLRIATGFDGEYRHDGLSFRFPLPPEGRSYGRTQQELTDIERSQNETGLGAFVEAIWDAHPRLRLTPGIRGDWFHISKIDRFTFDPRIVVRWSETDRRTWKAGAGIFHQPPMPQQLDAQFGNPGLPVLWADQYHLGIEQKLTDVIGVDLTGYYLRRHDLPVPSAEIGERFAPTGVGRSYGLELLARHEMTRHFFGWIAYTLSRSEENEVPAGGARTGPPSQTGSGDGGYHPTAFDQTHNLILVASYKLGAWEMGTRFRVVTGIPQTPIEGSSYDADYDAYQPRTGEVNSTRRQTFHQLDARIERTWTKDTWQLGAYLDVQNVYNEENPEATIWDYRFRESAPIRGLPILPTLGVRGRF